MLFLGQLLVAWALVFVGTYRYSLGTSTCTDDGATCNVALCATDVMMQMNLQYVLVGLSLLASLLISVDRMMEAKARWRQLRTSAGAVESLIWKFRTRTGPFSPKASPSKPEVVLSHALTEWSDALLKGAS